MTPSAVLHPNYRSSHNLEVGIQDFLVPERSIAYQHSELGSQDYVMYYFGM
jgi:hypothetical protein